MMFDDISHEAVARFPLQHVSIAHYTIVCHVTESSLLSLSLLLHFRQLLTETHSSVNILLVKRLSFQQRLD